MQRLFAFLSLMPFFIFFICFMVLPLIWIIINAFYIEDDEAYGLGNFIIVFESRFYMQSIMQSLSITFFSSIIGLVFGTIASYSLYVLNPCKISKLLFSFNAMISNFSGVPLAFAFIIVLGTHGVFNVLLKNIGIEPFIDVYSNIGINIIYIYFQIPLAILLLFPAFKNLEHSHKQALHLLGGNIFDYWLKIGIPLLIPALCGVFVILFANALGAYASIYALSNGNYNILPIRIASLIAGDINLNPYLASALSLILVALMLVITVIANFISKKYNFKEA